MNNLLKYWDIISHSGAANAGYSEARRIILSNQVAFLGTVTPQLYNLAYVIYDFKLLLPPILLNVTGSLICLSVLFLNHRGHTRVTKYIITIVPNLQIFLLTYYLGTATGMHLLHIMLVSFVLFLMSSERQIVLWPVSAMPVVLFFISYVKFTPEHAPIHLSEMMNQLLYSSHALTVFLLTMLFFSLFFQVMLVAERLLENEYRRSENLLLSILPDEVAQRLKEYPETIADNYPCVTILFADIVGFTGIASSVTPERLVTVLNSIFSRFDQLVDKYQLEKIKTIGDA
ncbi:MAG: adenylate/guanylate cyclase domain-containing protein, partial [Gammaproteobacteria bacterium]